MEKTQLQALIITILIIVGLGLFFVPESFYSNLELKEWMPKFENTNDSSKDNSAKSKTSKKKKRNYTKDSGSNIVIDSHLGVPVYHNGTISAVYGRNLTEDGYNLGLKYQCVEFVKRFYYEHYNHKMKQSYGHAKEFFDWNVGDGEFNMARGLNQYRNGSFYQPRQNAILVFGPDGSNSFGHVGIIASVRDDEIEMVSQNNGRDQKSRSSIPLTYVNGKWRIKSKHVLGWLSR